MGILETCGKSIVKCLFCTARLILQPLNVFRVINSTYRIDDLYRICSFLAFLTSQEAHST